MPIIKNFIEMAEFCIKTNTLCSKQCPIFNDMSCQDHLLRDLLEEIKRIKTEFIVLQAVIIDRNEVIKKLAHDLLDNNIYTKSEYNEIVKNLQKEG